VATLFDFDNTYARELEGFYVSTNAVEVPTPKLLRFNRSLAEELGLDAGALDSELGAAIFSGNRVPEGASPLAQAYAGHQFGGFSPRLGDGRALLLGELIDGKGRRRDIQLKGSGPTPFSRGGDGKSALGPVLREYLVSEAMHRLGIPTTRALAAVATGESVRREKPLPGGVLTRVAASHIRVGTFQFFAARGQIDRVRQLADYSIERHYPELGESEDRYLDLLAAVRNAQARLVAKWVHVGFVHGVMNTDNTAISGETIDYGPCAFIDRYSAGEVFSSIDRGGRYAFGNQPLIARWNLERLAETLLPLIDEDETRAVERATEKLGEYQDLYVDEWLSGVRRKLGLGLEEEEDLQLANDFLVALEGQKADYTLAFRRLSRVAMGEEAPLRALLEDPAGLDPWIERWRTRLEREEQPSEARAEAMDGVNPIYIPRNHKVEEALEAAVKEDTLEPFESLLQVLEEPYEEREGLEEYASPAPEDFGPYRTFCGT